MPTPSWSGNSAVFRSDVSRLQEVEQKAVGRQRNLGLHIYMMNLQNITTARKNTYYVIALQKCYIYEDQLTSNLELFQLHKISFLLLLSNTDRHLSYVVRSNFNSVLNLILLSWFRIKASRLFYREIADSKKEDLVNKNKNKKVDIKFSAHDAFLE